MKYRSDSIQLHVNARPPSRRNCRAAVFQEGNDIGPRNIGSSRLGKDSFENPIVLCHGRLLFDLELTARPAVDPPKNSPDPGSRRFSESSIQCRIRRGGI